jgi:hypothetical protein
MALMVMAAQGFAQTLDPTVIEKMDDLDRQKILLVKQIEVVTLENGLQSALGKGNTLSTVKAADLTSTNLRLIKITGLETAPQAVFLYNGYRLVAEKGGMVLPTVQLRTVTPSHVTVKDVKTGEESILWLTAENHGGSTTAATSR